MSVWDLSIWLLVGGTAWVGCGRTLARQRPAASPLLWLAPAVLGAVALTTLAQLDPSAPAFAGVARRCAVFWVAGALLFSVASLLPAGLLARHRWAVVATGLGLQLAGLVTGGNLAGKISVRVPAVGPVVVTDLTRLSLLVFTAAMVWRLESLLDQSLRRRCVRPLLAVAACWGASITMSMLAQDTGAAALSVGVLAGFAYLALGRPGPTMTLAAAGVAVFGLALVMFPHAILRVTSFLSPPGGDRIEQGRMALFASSSGRYVGHPSSGAGLQHVGSTLDDDFLLAAVGRTLGATGVFATVLLVALLAWACLLPAIDREPSGFGTWVGVGASVTVVLQLALAAGGVFGLVPATGVTVPMMTGSGASLLATYTLVGLVAGGGSRRRPSAAPHLVDVEVQP